MNTAIHQTQPQNISSDTSMGEAVEQPSTLIEATPADRPDLSSDQGIAKAVITQYYPGGLHFVTGRFCHVDNDETVEVTLQELHRNILSLLGNRGSAALAKRVTEYLQMTCAELERDLQPKPGHIYFTNGAYEIATGALTSHPTQRWIHGTLPHPFIPTSEPPTIFLDFLNQIFRDDFDKEQKIALVQQWLGYLLVSTTEHSKMLMLLGSGANGKSVLSRLTEAILGSENVSHAMLDRLGVPAVRHSLINKLANISEDLPLRPLADGYLKALIAGDKVDAERKYHDPCTVKLFCRLMVVTNHLPFSRDNSEGFFRRVIILTFNRQFSEAEQNPKLLETLIQDIPKIIPWAIQGLKNLQAQGSFTIPPSSDDALKTYRRELNPVEQFAEECLVPSEDGRGLAAPDVLALYSCWAKSNGTSPKVSSTMLGRQLTLLGYSSKKSSTIYWLVAPSQGALLYLTKSRLTLPHPQAYFASPARASSPRSIPVTRSNETTSVAANRT